jgi:hypothetical protein
MSEMVDVSTEPPRVWTDYCGTSFANDEPSYQFSLRSGRCYELSAWAILKGDLDDGILVHGSMRCENGESARMGHGWVLINNGTEVWEPILGACYAREDWYRWAQAEDEATYDAEQLRIMMLRHGHYGRWHESEWP